MSGPAVSSVGLSGHTPSGHPPNGRQLSGHAGLGPAPTRPAPSRHALPSAAPRAALLPAPRRTVLLLAALVVAAAPAGAQELTLSLGEEGSLSGRSIQLLALITVLSLAPGLAIMITCFPFLVTVLSILRQAIGLQQSPPNMLIVSLAMFLTWFIMEPVFTEAWAAGVQPLMDGTLPLDEAFTLAIAPFRGFMGNRIDGETFAALAALRPPAVTGTEPAAAPLSLLVPSFLLSEIQRAFEIGFLIYLPFLIIDLVVSAVLMSMGMMMVPPAIVSMPFKLAFFVVADGWALVSGALVRSYF